MYCVSSTTAAVLQNSRFCYCYATIFRCTSLTQALSPTGFLSTLLLLYYCVQGTTQTGQDVIMMVKTLGHRVLAPLALWKIVPNRRFDAATKRFDALATGLIAQEKAKLAAAASAGIAANGSAKDSCLLTQLVQYGEGDASDTAGAASESGPRNVLTSEEVLLLLLLLSNVALTMLS
jgi:hypothetical protein